MKAHTLPYEQERLARLFASGILDSEQDPDFDAITAYCAEVFEVPICLVSFVAEHHQWFKSRVGLNVCETSRESSICAHAMLETDGILVIEDTLRDSRTLDNPLVLGEPNIRFYAGGVIMSDTGIPLGALCVIDRVPRVPTDFQLRTLKVLTNQVAALVRHRESVLALNQHLLCVEQLMLEAEERENLLDVMLNSQGDAVALIDEGGTILRMNSHSTELLNLLGINTSDGNRNDGVWGPYDPTIRRALKLASSRQHVRCTAKWPSASGEIRWHDIRLHSIPGLDEASSKVLVICRDVSPEKSAELSAHQARTQLRNVIDEMPALIGYWTKDLRCQLANAEYEDWFGVPHTEMLGMSIEDVLGEAVYRTNRPYIEAVLEGEPQTFQRSLTKANGEVSSVISRYIPDVQDGGTVGFYVLVQDITKVQKAMDRLHLAQEVAKIGSWEFELATGEVTWTPELYRIVGLDPSGPPPDYEGQIALYVDGQRIADAVTDCVLHGTPYDFVLRRIAGDGTTQYCHAIGKPMFSSSGEVIRIVGTLRDVTEEKRVEALAFTQRALVEASSDFILITNEAGEVHYSNPKAMGFLSALTKSDSNVFQRFLSVEGHEIEAHVQNAISNAGYWSGRLLVNASKETKTTILEGLIYPISHESTRESLGIGWVLRDITTQIELEANLSQSNIEVVQTNIALQEKVAIVEEQSYALHAQKDALLQLNAELKRLSETDSLTRAWNRRYALSFAVRTLQSGSRERTSTAFLMLDVDHFKSINDSHGHSTGDQVLVEVSRVIQAKLAPDTVLARWGGEEFLIICPCLPDAEAIALSEAIRLAITECPHLAVRVTVSVGVTTSCSEETDPDAIIDRADRALYAAKASGRNCTRFLGKSEQVLRAS